MRKLLLVTAAALVPLTAQATNGYFAHGNGMKAQGMGGVGIALPQETMSGAANPANLGFVGNRLDVELNFFRPTREAEITGNGAGRNGTYDANERDLFYIPGVGYNRMIRPNLALGLLVYGNGGMNTSFANNPFGGAFGGNATNGGVDYMQLFIAPTLAWKPNENHSIGLSLNLVYHQFGASGLEGFRGMSQSPNNLTNRGRDDSTGIGFRIGWTGRITDALTLGAMYQPKTNMGKLDGYKGLFRNQGELDIPATYGLGVAYKATPKLTLGADVQQIDYARVASIGERTDFACMLAGTCPLGASNGAGFGWRNMTAIKLGASYDFSPTLTLRAGYATGDQPIPADQTFFNIIFPAVVEDHLTFGATWKATAATEVTVGYTHAFKKTVNGSGSIPAGFGGGEANLRMYQNSLGVAIGWKM
jgi:long-chain fatty acid transport protein